MRGVKNEGLHNNRRVGSLAVTSNTTVAYKVTARIRLLHSLCIHYRCKWPLPTSLEALSFRLAHRFFFRYFIICNSLDIWFPKSENSQSHSHFYARKSGCNIYGNDLSSIALHEIVFWSTAHNFTMFFIRSFWS